MQIKKLSTIIFVSVIIIFGIIYFIFFKTTKTELFKNNQNQELAFQDKKIKSAEKPFNIDITYPEISGQDEFNGLAKNIVDAELSEFKNNSVENDKAVKEVDPESYAKYPREYDFIISYDRGQLDENIASVVFNVYKFEGGAHGASYQVPLNYNLKENKKILLADVFSGQESYAQKISDFCIQDLKKQITESLGTTDGTWIKDGAGPIAENFGTFLINKESITFYFPQYQVAPGAFGGFKVVMPR